RARQELPPAQPLSATSQEFAVPSALCRLDRFSGEREVGIEPTQVSHLVREIGGEPGDCCDRSVAPRELESLLIHGSDLDGRITALVLVQRNVDVALGQERAIT